MRSKTASAEANFEPGRAAAKVRRQKKKKKREREKRAKYLRFSLKCRKKKLFNKENKERETKKKRK